MAEIEKYEKEISDGANPRDHKMKLAYETVCFYHSQKEAEQAQEFFINTFSKKEIPDEMPEIKPTAYDIVTVLMESKCVTSKTDARRVISQGGVKIDKQVVENVAHQVKPGDILQKGKRVFVKVM